ncbi:MAG: hypothetical protein BIFFINMI_00934 [Phycisphaerae bacterium]|nr:hypothetical protein [Phycisphaerae bacterium]
MTSEADRFWQQVAKDLARRSGVAPLTPEEAQKEFDALPDEKLSDSQISSIIEQVTSGELAVWTPEPVDLEVPGADSQAIEEDVYQLNRNEGQADAETDDLLDELRRKALEDGSPDGQENQTGLGGDSEPPGKGD